MAYASRYHYPHGLTSTSSTSSGSTPGHGRRSRGDDAGEGRFLHKRSSSQNHCCALGFLKSVLYFFCCMLLLAGLLLTAMSAYTIVYRHSLRDLLTTDGGSLYASLTYLLVIAAATLVSVSALGCCATAKENRCLLMMFSFCLFAIFLVEACSTGIAYMYEPQVHSELARRLNATIQHRYGKESLHTEAIDRLQQKFKCCGALNHIDWEHRTHYVVVANVSIAREPRPLSCCRSPGPGCTDVISSQTIYYRGCIDILEIYIREHLIIIGAVAAGVCSLQIFGIMFSCCLSRSIKQWKQRHTYEM